MKMQPSQLKALGLTEENNLVTRRSTISQHVDDFYKTDCNQVITELYNWSVWGNFSGDFLRQEGQTENMAILLIPSESLAASMAMSGQTFSSVAAVAYDYSWLDWSNSRGHGNN